MDPTIDSYSLLNPDVNTLLNTSSMTPSTSLNVAPTNGLTTASSSPSLLDTVTNTFGSAVNALESVFTTSTQTALNNAQANANAVAAQQAAARMPASSSSLMMWVVVGLGVILLVRD